MKLLPVPVSLSELTRNIRSIVEDYSIQSPRYLGKTCEVVDTENDAIKEVKMIEQAVLGVFEGIVKTSEQIEAKDLYAFKGIITIYDWKEQLDRQHPSEVGKSTCFPLLMERIESVYRSIAPKKSHPHLASTVREYQESIKDKRTLKEELKACMRAQHLLSHLMFQKGMVPFYSQFNLFYVLNYFCDNHYKLEEIALPAHLRESKDLLRMTGSALIAHRYGSLEEVIEISRVSYAFGLVYAKCLSEVREEDPRKKIINFDVSALTQIQAKKLAFEIDFSLKNQELSSSVREFLTLIQNLIKRNFIVHKKDEFLKVNVYKRFALEKDKLTGSSERISEAAQDELISGRFIERIREYVIEQKTKIESNSSEYDNFKIDMYYYIDLQTILAEFQLSLPLYEELYVLGYQKIIEEIPDLKSSQKLGFIKCKRALHNQELFAPLRKFQGEAQIEDSKEGAISDFQKDKVVKSSKVSSKKRQQPYKGKAPLSQEQEVSTLHVETNNGLTERFSQRSNLPYAGRVIEWFDDPESALSRPPYSDYTAEKRISAVIHHTFPKVIDEYMTSFGVESIRYNERSRQKERHVSIPTLVKFDDGREDHAILTYCFTSEGLLYHRCSSLKPLNDIIRELMNKGHWDMDFPTLEESQKQNKKPSKTQESKSSDYGVVLEEASLYKVKIRDERNEITYTIVNIND